MTRATPALDQALTHLRGLTSAGPDHRLPVLAGLARQAGVSHVTMMRALHVLRDQGVVSVSHRHGVRVLRRPDQADAPPPPLSAPQSMQKWKRLAERIGSDMNAGAFPSDALPPTKELLSRYGISYPTLRKALAELCAREALAASRTRHRIVRPSTANLNGTVVLIAAADASGGLAMGTNRTRLHLSMTESLCAGYRVRLALMPFDWNTSRLLRSVPDGRTLSELLAHGTVLGFVVWLVLMSAGSQVTLLQRLTGYRLPVAALDEWGEPEVARQVGLHSRTKVFCMATSAEPARAVGRHLLALGHTRVAYLSPVTDARWSFNRLRGLREAFDAVAGASVTPIVAAKHVQLHGTRPFDGYAPRLAELIRRIPHGLRGKDGRVAGRVLSGLAAEVPTVAFREHYRATVMPLFEQAIAQHQVTAWVCDNDATALMALEFLAARKVDVPGRISVAGFDDEPAASQHGLTSHNFNGQGTMQAMLAHVLQPGRERADGPVEVPGYVVQRRSSGPVRQAR
jgi:DNA-binding LacI/PurR family transcriptional regulator/DNA-binding FadR family transcriptional regulator